MMRRLIRGSTLSLNSQYDIAGDSSYRKFCRRRYFRQFFFLVQSKAVIWQIISKSLRVSNFLYIQLHCSKYLKEHPYTHTTTLLKIFKGALLYI